MERYEKYKDSGVEWIVEIPEGWEVKKLKYIANTTLGKMLTNSDKGNYKKRKYLRAANIEWLNVNISDVKEMWFSDDELKRLRLEEGDLLVSEGGEVGRTCIWKKELDECYIQNSVHKVTFNSQNNPEYFLNQFFVMGYKGAFDSIVNRISIGHLTGEKLKEICFIKPLLTEQIAIAKYLDRKTAEIDELITQKEWLIEMYEEEKTAIINQAVTKGIDPDVKLKDSGIDGIDWLGEIPEGWKVKKLKYVLSINNGDSIKSEAIQPVGDYPVYGGNGIVGYTDDFNNNDVVFVIGRVGAKCGNVRLVSGKKWISDNALIAYAKGNLKFIELCLFNFDLNKLANKNAQPLITSSMIKEQYITFPLPDEQIAIVHHIEAEITRINAKIAKTKKIIELQKEYRTALISEVVTGKIKVIQEVSS